MAEMYKIQSFKTFSQLKAEEKEIQLQEEARGKREQLVTKIGETLAEMDITSFDELSEEQKKALVAKLFNEETKEVEQAAVTEAIKVEGKRDAKKVLTVYNKIFNKVLVDLGAMSTDSILGCVKYLMQEAMIDANFHREAAPVSKLIKGTIKPLEIKMPGLGGHFVKIGPTTIKTILDKYYSDIANAAGWSGLGIVEGTALYLEQIKQEPIGYVIINKFNQSFEGADVRIDLDSKLNESKDSTVITVLDETTKLEERNAFLGARAKAIAEDLEEFEFNGKIYPVTVNESNVLNESTRWQFGIIDKAGKIRSNYVHYDGYPSSVIPQIEGMSAKQVRSILKDSEMGGMSSLDKPYNDSQESTITTGTVKNIKKYLKDVEDEGGAEYVYLFDEKSGKWVGANTYVDKDLKPFDQIEESVVTEANYSLSKLEDMGFKAGEDYFEKVKGLLKNGPDLKAYKKGFSQGFVDNAAAYGVKESVVAEASKMDKEFKAMYAAIKEHDLLMKIAKDLFPKIAKEQKDGVFVDFKPLSQKQRDEVYVELVKRLKLQESVLNESSQFLFYFDYNTDEDDVDYIQSLLKKAGVDAVAQPGLDSEEMVVKAKNAVELRKAKKAIKANGFEIYEAVVNEAEVKSDEDFKEYAETVLKKAFGEDYDEAKAGEVINGLTSKYSGDYGAMVGALQSSLN